MLTQASDLKVSVITVAYNSAETIEDTINSVAEQGYKNIEYIIVDGASKDSTLEIVRKYESKISKLISEPDEGIYDAMNKGIKLATGEIIGILNSDDIYADKDVVENVVENIVKNNVDSCYGDLVYVDKHNLEKTIRYWKSGEYKEDSFKHGWVPPHPTFFVKNWVYKKYGVFDLDLPIAADHEILFRFMYKHKIKTCYIPRVLVKMRMGGLTNKSILNIIRQNNEIVQTLRKNKIKVTPAFFINKLIDKSKQHFNRKR